MYKKEWFWFWLYWVYGIKRVNNVFDNKLKKEIGKIEGKRYRRKWVLK